MITLDKPQSSVARRSAVATHYQSTFAADDGAELFYRAWLPRGGAVDRAVLLLHRGHEHSGRMADVAASFVEDGFAVFAWDARGHGRSPGARGYASDFAQVVRDLDRFAAHVTREHRIDLQDIAVVAHSVSAVVATAWVHDYAPPIRALVLATPAFRVKLYVPLALPMLRVLSRLRPGATIKSYVRPNMLTHDAAQAEAYRNDPLISRDISVRVLLGLHDTGARIIADAGAIETPTLVLTAGCDWVVNNHAVRRFFERLGSPRKVLREYDCSRHALFHEIERETVVGDVRRFINEVFEEPRRVRGTQPSRFTRAEFERLSASAPKICPRATMFRASRLMLNTVGRLSEGVRIGWDAGFDSGQSLDHVYRNEPRGITSLGRLIDRNYLNAVGWVGIRQRRTHLERALRACIENVHADGLPVKILDVASGPGRYVLETIASVSRAAPEMHISAVLRDRSQAGLDAGRAIARENGLSDEVQFQVGDAFDPSSIATVTPRPTIAIVSGLYELFEDNALVLRSLRALFELLPPGGRLIYTNQPWHPQVELIARVLPNRDGKPWVMRRRPQAEMDVLVAAAGFAKLGTAVDDAGIFTVSVARKEA